MEYFLFRVSELPILGGRRAFSWPGERSSLQPDCKQGSKTDTAPHVPLVVLCTYYEKLVMALTQVMKGGGGIYLRLLPCVWIDCICSTKLGITRSGTQCPGAQLWGICMLPTILLVPLGLGF